MSKRADYIRANYSLTCEPDGTWIARRWAADEIRGSDREAVAWEARGQWGHFNFTDEARAFSEIFAPVGGNHVPR